MNVTYKAIRFEDKLALFQDPWSPKVIAQMNDYQLKLAKVEGDFVWHHHSETDEVFIVLSGKLTIEFRDGSVALDEGEMFVVPKGVEHKPWAEQETSILLIEPKDVVNTGEAGGDLTAERDVWV